MREKWVWSLFSIDQIILEWLQHWVEERITVLIVESMIYELWLCLLLLLICIELVILIIGLVIIHLLLVHHLKPWELIVVLVLVLGHNIMNGSYWLTMVLHRIVLLRVMIWYCLELVVLECLWLEILREIIGVWHRWWLSIRNRPLLLFRLVSTWLDWTEIAWRVGYLLNFKFIKLFLYWIFLVVFMSILW